MKQYKLINNKTKEEHICSKVVIDGFDYYISDEPVDRNDIFVYNNKFEEIQKLFPVSEDVDFELWCKLFKKVVASNNSSIDIPQVINNQDWLNIAIEEEEKEINFNKEYHSTSWYNGVKLGFNKAKELYPFSREDVKSLIEFISNEKSIYSIMYGDQEKRFATSHEDYTIEELINIWQEQRIQTIYYE